MNYSPEVFLKACELAEIPIARAKFAVSLLENVQDIVNRFPTRYIPIDVEVLLEDVCWCSKLTKTAICSNKRDRHLADTRAAFCILAKEVFPNITDETLSKIICKNRSMLTYYRHENKKCIDKNQVYWQIRKELHI